MGKDARRNGLTKDVTLFIRLKGFEIHRKRTWRVRLGIRCFRWAAQCLNSKPQMVIK